MSTFEDQRFKQTDLAVIHDSPSIRAGPSIVLFWKFRDTCRLVNCQAVFVLEGHHQTSHMAVTQQVFKLAFCLCNLIKLKHTWPCVDRKLSFFSYIITYMYRLLTLAKTETENCNTYPFAFRFVVHWAGVRRATYLQTGIWCLIYYSCELWPCVDGILSRNLNPSYLW